ncbi:LPXTG-motif cell wall anchor domain-containing protein/fimbrial isopeptide formation D2 domain-containing protein [Pilibacter termitis]|uniref:LPXTG-motif cell wall anchor domain-containing protein/fimbrial isopeptide formation D2 domain-containing protein n=1 Tax=Pilibacter termitis TaxID=263852 RepID=A0A1T4KBI0_9ENTE|nr:SpaH/EbpB family LPXTG-anchored major pilin [Pilibacter termitis]SJZ39790.1 LPXTG-motif cell wall anchor domain-containing protein/fimbrial isopeptide formation D2 domain-containing protein [Pilibacter termitis]
MNNQQKKLGLVSVVAVCLFMAMIFLPTKTFADVAFEIHKVENASAPNYDNNGYEEPSGLDVSKPMAGAKFTVVDLTSDFYGSYMQTYLDAHSGAKRAEVYEAYVAMLKLENNTEIKARGSVVGSESGPTEPEHGVVTIPNIPETSGGKDAIYAVLETTPPPNNISVEEWETATMVVGSVPTIVALPMYGDDGTTKLETIKLYPKNEVGGIEKVLGDGTENSPYKNVQIGKGIYYTIKFKVPNDVGTKLANGHYKYRIIDVVDIPGVGLTVDRMTIEKIEGEKGTWIGSQARDDNYADFDVLSFPELYSEPLIGNGRATAGFVFEYNPDKVTSPSAIKWEDLAGATITVSVDGHINHEADVNESIKNKTRYSVWQDDDTVIVPGEDEVESFTQMYKFKKNDSVTGAPLAGATFKISVLNEVGGEEELSFVEETAGVYHVADSTESGVPTLSVNENGELIIKGLDADVTYTITETNAPAGYRLDTTPIEFRPMTKEQLEFQSYDRFGELSESGNYVDGFHNIYNVSETVLPTTGGKGFIVFTVASLSLLGISAVFFMMKRKVKALAKVEDENK